MKTILKVTFILVALAMFLPMVSVRAQDTSYVGATVGTTYTYHEVFSDTATCFAWTMHIDNITYVDSTESTVGVTETWATILGNSVGHDLIPVYSDAGDTSSLDSYIVNKNIVNKTDSYVIGDIRYTTDHDSNGVLSDWIYAYTNGTVIEGIYSGAGSGCTGLGGTGLFSTPGYDFLIVGAITLLGVAILAVQLKRKYYTS